MTVQAVTHGRFKMNPTSQHEAQAKKILARRANANNNETGKATEIKTVPTSPTQDKAYYEGKNLNDLRTICTERKIKYKNKHAKPALIAKLLA